MDGGGVDFEGLLQEMTWRRVKALTVDIHRSLT
jgi:hypothetical protein